ncbi:50S ribosomal protein L21 [Christensenella tenuis]|jgi:large subunit ribosomal protein L21|uniref:Large ribosomal subunit protein bL21 n=1 Tax=Christensenella tenuis TaxID=2763033 RepID=A0ABR7EGN6_9FIRM|nr:50S ribosomal protein L21 [Christensenella tenuis]
MYAIIRSGGKQYKVEPGMVVKVEKLDAEVGSEVSFEAMMTSDGNAVQVGQPVLADVVVKGKVLAQDKAKKVIVFKYKPKKDYRKKQGHRQPYTKVEIIQVGSEVAKAKPAAAKKKDDAAQTAEEKKTAISAAPKAAAEKKPAVKKTAEKPAAEKKPAAKKTAEKPAAEKKPAAKKTAEKPAAEKKPAAAKKEEKETAEKTAE